MAKALLRLSLLLSVFFLVVVVALHTQPYDDSALRTLLVSSPDCALPCWQGIHPGITSGVDAIAILQDHAWVGYVRVRGDLAAGYPGTITWTWSGQQPPTLGASRAGGRLLVIDNVVQYVRLPTTLPFGDIWLSFNHPEAGRLDGPSGFASRQEMFHQASYRGGALMVESVVVCPMQYDALWNTPVTVELRQEMRLLPLVDYRLAQWMANAPC
jgi:hypothetical protein